MKKLFNRRSKKRRNYRKVMCPLPLLVSQGMHQQACWGYMQYEDGSLLGQMRPAAIARRVRLKNNFEAAITKVQQYHSQSSYSVDLDWSGVQDFLNRPPKGPWSFIN